MDRPPLGERLAEVENKTRRIISSGGSAYENGWYLLSELESEYTDAIIMIHKGYNNSTSNGYIIGYSYQHNQVDSDKDGTFNIINKSGTGAFKDIAIVDYKGIKCFAVRFNRGNTDPEMFSFTIYGNSVSNKLKERFEFIGANPEDFTIMRRKTLSS